MAIFEELMQLDKRARKIEYQVTPSGCWNCTSHARRKKDGYYRVEREGVVWGIHRYIYTLTKGPIPPELVIRHLCNNPDCINPEHLEAGTQLENIADQLQRGTHISQIRRRMKENGTSTNPNK